MKVSYNWLKDYIDIEIPPEKLAELLTMAGLAVDSIERKADDYILETEITANRPDWLSLIGVAREISAITGGKLNIPLSVIRGPSSEDKSVKIKIEDKDLCPRYTARIIRGVNIADSPAWLKRKIESVGLRTVNNVVDITNFCLFEKGVPMHAFDLDKLEGGIVIVRRAKKGEKVVTIDGVERALDESVLVIADKLRPIAIAGLMGALDTEVRVSTKNILLEAAYFDPISVRRASRRLGISTESSYRFERKVDMANIANASSRASHLISEIAGGRMGGFLDVGLAARAKKQVALEYKRLNSILGLEIAPAKVKKILSGLGLKAASSSKDKIKFDIPPFRYDLKNEIDLIEEVARVYGYHNMPVTIPAICEQPFGRPREMVVEEKIRERLTGLGLDEIITYSLLSKKSLNASASPAECVIEIKNPLTGEQEAMRPDLMAGMCGAFAWNINRKIKDLKLFELGRVYLRKGQDLVTEKRHLSVGLAGEAYSSWAGGARRAGFFDLKGIIEALLEALRINGISFKHVRKDGFSPSASASINTGGETAGFLGEISGKVLNNFGIKEPVFFGEICVDSLFKHVRLEKRFVELPKYPSISRDISIVVDKFVSHSDLIAVIKAAGGDAILRDIKLVDRYTGKQIPDDKVGLTYRLEYQDFKKTLEDKEVSEIHARILQSLGEKLGAYLR